MKRAALLVVLAAVTVYTSRASALVPEQPRSRLSDEGGTAASVQGPRRSGRR